MFQTLLSLGQRLSGFGKSVLSEADGTGSTSRVIGLMVTAAACGVLIAHVVMQRSLPTAEQLGGISALAAAGSSAYVANKITGKGGQP